MADPLNVTKIYIATSEDQIAAGVIFLTSLVGILANGFIALTTGRLPLLKNSFGQLLRLQSSAEAVFLSVWCFYFAPALMFNIHSVKAFEISRRFGQLCLTCYDISIYTHLSMSVNRFVSLYFPTHYGHLFTDKFTTYIIVGILAVSFGFSWVLPAVGCSMEFSNTKWMLDYHQSCDFTFLFWAEFIRSVSIITLIFVINAFTFTKMHFHNSRKQGVTAFETIQQQKRKSAEVNFVQQVCLQGVAYVTELITYFVLALFFTAKWPNFLLTTWAWLLVHTADGIITLVFNKQFRTLLFPDNSSVQKSRPSGVTLGSSKELIRRPSHSPSVAPHPGVS